MRVMTANNLPINKGNLEVVAGIKLECKKHRIPLEMGINYYSQITKIETTLTGKNLFDYLVRITNYKPHRTTILRWFDGNFNNQKTYHQDVISRVLLHALIYNLRTNNYASKQESNRSSTISTKKAKYH
ncbi:MAG: hypothetical protein ACKPCK_13540 [Dolichospermum sp.]